MVSVPVWTPVWRCEGFWNSGYHGAQAHGSMFLGEVHEPIKGPESAENAEFRHTVYKPIAIQFDYKVKMSDREKRIRATGFSRITDVEGKDFPESESVSAKALGR